MSQRYSIDSNLTGIWANYKAVVLQFKSKGTAIMDMILRIKVKRFDKAGKPLAGYCEDSILYQRYGDELFKFVGRKEKVTPWNIFHFLEVKQSLNMKLTVDRCKIWKNFQNVVLLQHNLSTRELCLFQFVH